jgi:hypothetical protein
VTVILVFINPIKEGVRWSQQMGHAKEVD